MNMYISIHQLFAVSIYVLIFVPLYAIQTSWTFLPGEGQPKIASGRPQTSASTRGDTGPDAMQTQRANRAALFIKTMNTIHEERVHSTTCDIC